MRRIIILRHGYNFEENEPARRIGSRTNISLIERGKKKIAETAKYFKEEFSINKIISASLIRTIESANIVKSTINFQSEIILDKNFNEIDYGPDEGKTEEEVIKRIGKQAIDRWEKYDILPDGWVANKDEIRNNWIKIAEKIQDEETILIVTSAGIAKFAKYICEGDLGIYKEKFMKINPGNFAIIEKDKIWQIQSWNIQANSK